MYFSKGGGGGGGGKRDLKKQTCDFKSKSIEDMGWNMFQRKKNREISVLCRIN